MGNGQKKTVRNKRKGGSFWDNLTKAASETIRKVCTTTNRIVKDTVKQLKKVDWKKAAVVTGAILAGAAITILTGGAGAPIAMALGGAVSGGIISGYDAYKSGKRGWDLAGAVVGGAATGAVTGFIGGQFVGAGASIATNLTKNIGNQVVRQIAKIGVESAVETVIDTGMDIAAGNKVNGQTIAMNFAFNTFTNGAGSVSSKKGAKANTNTGNKALRGEVLDSGYKHSRPIKDVTHGQTGGSQKLLTGPDSKTLRIESPKEGQYKPFLPDDHYKNRLPERVSPGIDYLHKHSVDGEIVQTKFYDSYGREKGWVDYTTHNQPGHTNPHSHQRIYNQHTPEQGYKIDYRTDSSFPKWLGD